MRSVPLVYKFDGIPLRTLFVKKLVLKLLLTMQSERVDHLPPPSQRLRRLRFPKLHSRDLGNLMVFGISPFSDFIYTTQPLIFVGRKVHKLRSPSFPLSMIIQNRSIRQCVISHFCLSWILFSREFFPDLCPSLRSQNNRFKDCPDVPMPWLDILRVMKFK